MSNPNEQGDAFTQGHRQGLLGAAENVVSKIHGAGESLRGSFNTTVDQAVHGNSTNTDRAAINRGQEEWNTGRYMRKSDRHFDTPSYLENPKKHPQGQDVTGDRYSDVPVYRPEQEPGMSAGTMAAQEEGPVAHSPGDPTVVERRPGTHSGGDVHSGQSAYEQGYLEGRSVGEGPPRQGAGMHGAGRAHQHPGDLTMGDDVRRHDFEPNA